MGLLDDLFAASEELHTKPKGWVTRKEFAASIGCGYMKATRDLDRYVKEGKLQSRDWKCDSNGNTTKIYSDAV